VRTSIQGGIYPSSLITTGISHWGFDPRWGEYETYLLT
jgi:hypothetical protein